MCPFCRSTAPVVHRGVLAYCTTCGQLRGPVTARSVTIAGKTSQVGGVVATVFGYTVLGLGLTTALTLGLFLSWLFPGTMAPWVVSLPITFLTMLTWWLSRSGGKKLTASGKETERRIREEAIFALAEAAHGNLSAQNVATALNLSVYESDALLTEMAKKLPDHMALDLEESGAIRYRFTRIDLEHRLQVEEQRAALAQPGARASGTEKTRIAEATAAPNVRVEAQAPLVAEFIEYAQEQARTRAVRR